MDGIVVGDSVLEGRKLTSKVNVPRRLRKYFRTLDFFAIYDEDIDADKSILNIPALATVLPFAWLAGVDVYVDELDRTFKESMDKLKQVYKKDFPDAPLTTSIIADTLVENEISDIDPSKRTSLLFSGGVDSTYTLLNHLDLNPRLITFWGADNYPYPENAAQLEEIISTYSQFAQQMGLEYNVVKTNNSVILDDRRISHDFHQFIHDCWFRIVPQHTFILIPLTAPLSMCRFDCLLISGGSPRNPDDKLHEYTSRPETDEKFVWANLKVKHIVDIHRGNKIRGTIKDDLPKYNLKLKVCLGKLEKPQLNDSTCVKCLRTIASLALAGINPNKCGFQVNESTWTRFKEYLEHDLEQETFWAWRPFSRMQQSLPDNIDHDFYGSKDFFNWFRSFDLKSKEKDVWFYRDLYHSLPYSIAKLLNEIYLMMGIRIHDVWPRSRKKPPPLHNVEYSRT